MTPYNDIDLVQIGSGNECLLPGGARPGQRLAITWTSWGAGDLKRHDGHVASV